MNNPDTPCVICHCGVDDSKGKLIKATPKGIESLRLYSVVRHDDDLKTFLAGDPPVVYYHCDCRKAYTNDRLIEQQLKRAASVSTECTMPTKLLRSSLSSKFNWKEQCFFCSEVACSSSDKGKVVYSAQTLEVIVF